MTDPEPKPRGRTLARLANCGLLQVVWFAAIAGATGGQPWLGPAAAVAFALLHVGAGIAKPRVDLWIAMAAAMLGTVADTVVAALGLLTYDPGVALGPLAPPFMTALWLAFGLTLNSSLAWLRRRYLLGAALGAVCGPMAYYGAAHAGALHFAAGRIGASLVGIGVEWLVLTPLLLWLLERADRAAGLQADAPPADPSPAG